MRQFNNNINEQEVVEAFLEFLNRKKQVNYILDKKRPDRIERQVKAPDFLATDFSAGKRMAIEITSLYKSPEAGHEDSVWMETVGNLDVELRTRVRGSVWIFIPELSKNTPGLNNHKGRLSVRTKLSQVLPDIINSMPISNRPKRFTEDGIPFNFGIRKRKEGGSWVAISRLSPTSQSLDDVLNYLRQVLPGKNRKFCHPDFVSDEHVLLIDNLIPFLDQNLINNAFLILSKEVHMDFVNRMFMVELNRVIELKNPWATK